MGKSLISHNSTLDTALDGHLEAMKERLLQEGDKAYATSDALITLLDTLAEGALGQFLLTHKGLNGFWTDAIITYPTHPDVSQHLTALEKEMLSTFPVILATQERFHIFRGLLQKHVLENVVMASLPCGLMRDLLSLDFSHVTDFTLLGMDLDNSALEQAKNLAKHYALQSHTSFQQLDAWVLEEADKADVITSNGLNIYEPDPSRIIDLFRRFHRYLKPGGTLITSFLTTPPSLSNASEWDMDAINEQHLLMQRKIFADILQAKWQCFSSTQEITHQLKEAGFSHVEVFYDRARIFPTVVARKGFVS